MSDSTAKTQPRAVLYLRQSTYREESISLELQETACRDYCARMGYTVAAVEHDPGISGRTWKRPAVQRVMHLIEGGDAEVIVVWRWSRLSRNRKDWAIAADRVDIAGGRIESATEPNDVTAAGRFARGVMTELAAFESERIGESWKETQSRRRALGLPSGGKLPWGWVYLDGTVAPHPENGPAIAKLYQMYIAGAGWRGLARWLEEHGYRTYHGNTRWADNSLASILDSPVHAGYIVHKGEALPGAHEPLIDDVTWSRYKAVRRVRASERAVKTRYLLSGLLRCSCGERMYGFTIAAKYGHRTSKPYYAYRCLAINTDREHGPGTISTRLIDPHVVEWVRGRADRIDEAAPQQAVADERFEAQRIAREIAAIDRQLVTLTEQLVSDLVPERIYRATVERLEERHATLSASLQAVEDRMVMIPENGQAIASGLRDGWDTLPLDSKRQGLRELLFDMQATLTQPRQLVITPRGEDPVAIPL